MNFLQFFLHIDKKIPEGYLISITGETEEIQILFDPDKKMLTFLENNQLSTFLKKHEYQFRKILHNKKPETFFPAFSSSL